MHNPHMAWRTLSRYGPNTANTEANIDSTIRHNTPQANTTQTDTAHP